MMNAMKKILMIFHHSPPPTLNENYYKFLSLKRLQKFTGNGVEFIAGFPFKFSKISSESKAAGVMTKNVYVERKKFVPEMMK
jgi:hypothetical protein